MSKLTIVQLDDWVGVYRDGKLLDEGHSFHYSLLLHWAGADFEILRGDLSSSGVVDEQHIIDEGSLPEKLEDLKRV